MVGRFDAKRRESVISSQGGRSTVAVRVQENVSSRGSVQRLSCLWSIREGGGEVTKLLAKARGTQTSLHVHRSFISRLSLARFFCMTIVYNIFMILMLADVVIEMSGAVAFK